MPKIPAICEKCQAIYPSKIDLRAQDLTIVGCSQTCPQCGSEGKILDGNYSALGDALLVLLRQPNPDLAKVLVSVLQQGAKRQESREEICAKIQKTAPELQSWGDCLPKTRNELYAFIAIILVLLGIVIRCWSSNTEPTQQVINQYIDNSFNIIYRRGSGE